jgi:hypothetical protein
MPIFFQDNKAMIREDRQSLPGDCDYCLAGKIFLDFTVMSGIQKLLTSSACPSLRSREASARPRFVQVGFGGSAVKLCSKGLKIFRFSNILIPRSVRPSMIS